MLVRHLAENKPTIAGHHEKQKSVVGPGRLCRRGGNGIRSERDRHDDLQSLEGGICGEIPCWRRRRSEGILRCRAGEYQNSIRHPDAGKLHEAAANPSFGGHVRLHDRRCDGRVVPAEWNQGLGAYPALARTDGSLVLPGNRWPACRSRTGDRAIEETHFQPWWGATRDALQAGMW